MKGLISFLKLWTAVSVECGDACQRTSDEGDGVRRRYISGQLMLIRQAAFRKKEKRRQSGCRAVRE